MPAIEVKDLIKIYRVYRKYPGWKGTLRYLIRREFEDIRAVDGISFEVSEGELIGFLGPNGAGKTTTLKILAGLLYPTSGSVKVPRGLSHGNDIQNTDDGLPSSSGKRISYGGTYRQWKHTS